MHEYDVAVVGAGFAGVTAARDLSLAGLSVIHLEARDRIGGRTWLGEAFGREVELGGTYVHWTQPHAWHEVRRYGLTLAHPMKAERHYWLADGQVHSGDPVQQRSDTAPLVEMLLGDARARFPFPFEIEEHGDEADTQTVRERFASLGLSAYDRDVLAGLLSSLVHDEDAQGMGQFLYWTALQMGNWYGFMEVAGGWPIVGGTRRLLEAIQGDSTADLRLSTPVASIEADDNGVTVTTASGDSFRVRRVVVAAPLNTLADITFAPALPEVTADLVARKQPMRTRKIWARVKGEIPTFGASAPADKHSISTARTEYRHDGDTLVVIFSSDAESLDPNDRSAVQEALRVFVPDIEVVDTACHDWSHDPWSQGTWAHHRPGDLTGAVPRMREPHGAVHFVGGDIAPMGVGGIEGAIETGGAAARSIVAELARPGGAAPRG